MHSEMGLVSANGFVLPATEPAPVAVAAFHSGERLPAQSRSANWSINQTAFAELLDWLDRNPEAAGRQYELIRRKLIRKFTYKGCAFPEELADETFNRVTRKLPDIRHHFTGNPIRYFLGVAKKVYLENLKKAPCLPPPSAADATPEELLQHLDEALSKLTREDRKLILDYYGGSEQNKIDHRKDLAEAMGIPLNVLRVRTHRIRRRLKQELTQVAS